MLRNQPVWQIEIKVTESECARRAEKWRGHVENKKFGLPSAPNGVGVLTEIARFILRLKLSLAQGLRLVRLRWSVLNVKRGMGVTNQCY